MTFTKEEIDHNFENPSQKTWDGDDPKLDFQNDVFTGSNWNDERLVTLRKTINSLVGVGSECTLLNDLYSFEIKHVMDEDQHYVCINKKRALSDHLIQEQVPKKDVYNIEWYKSRGRTELVNLNGNPITVDELKDLLYLLNDYYLKM